MRRSHWIVGVLIVLVMATSPWLSAMAQDASPVTVDEPVSTDVVPEPTGEPSSSPTAAIFPERTAIPLPTATHTSMSGSDERFQADAEPSLLINGSSDDVVYVDPDGTFGMSFSNIYVVQSYPRSNCVPPDDGGWYGPSVSFTDQASDWIAYLLQRGYGFVMSVQGRAQDPDTGGFGETITSCRTIVFGYPPPPTNTAISAPTNTATLAPTDTATIVPTNTETVIPTNTSTGTVEPSDTATAEPTGTTLAATSTVTATATQNPFGTTLLINGSYAPVVPVDPAGDLRIEMERIDALRWYGGANCGGHFIDISSGSMTWPASHWIQALINSGQAGSVASVLGYDIYGNAVTDCRTIVFGLAPTPAMGTSTPTSTAEDNGVRLVVNGSEDSVVYVDPDGQLTIAIAGIDTVRFYGQSNCVPPLDISWDERDFGPSQSFTWLAENWIAHLVNTGQSGFVMSVRGYSAENDVITDCRTIVFGYPPPPTATATMTLAPTNTATTEPTKTVTIALTDTATPVPTETTTTAPTDTVRPINTATSEPTNTATREPTNTATREPSNMATIAPTDTVQPTNTATIASTNIVTTEQATTVTLVPTSAATVDPTETATGEPANTATTAPTQTSTALPVSTATTASTETATVQSTHAATLEPTSTVTAIPTHGASVTPSPTAAEARSLQVRVETSDGGAIPAGTTWLLSDESAIGSTSGAGRFFAAQRSGTQGGTLSIALPSGSLLPIENPIAFGAYTLTINAPGYQPFEEVIAPNEAITSVMVRLVAIPATTANGPGAQPTVTVVPIPVVGDLPNTGAGHRLPDSGIVGLMIVVCLAISGLLASLWVRRR